MKNVLIAILLALVVFMAERIVWIENQRYALVLGMCPNTLPVRITQIECLEEVHTRTSWIGHLYYGLTSRYY